MENEKQEYSFLGTGWSFPPSFSRSSRSVTMVENENDIQESLTILLSTSIGERFLQPGYGSDLKHYLFEPLNSGMKALIKDKIETAILYHEPRIKLISIDLLEADNDGRAELHLEYMVRSTNTRHNFVYPYYKDEGSEI
ncbi:MAG: GPW/gp25 family protein [Lentisphaeraceae bacterium]|nr:GPW/gp25 family protein [Lentisphaeraceae bacterium]